jgi:hypothetical protein
MGDVEIARLVDQPPLPFIRPDVQTKDADSLPDGKNTVSYLLEHDVLSPRETNVVQEIRKIYPDLYGMLTAIYPDREWRVCWPACIGLSRMISFKFGIPIGQNIEGEHLEICVGIYDPVDLPLSPDYASRDDMRIAEIEEQTYLKYYSPTGNVLLIDTIYPLLFKRNTGDDVPIFVEKYSPNTFDSEYARRHNVFSIDRYPFSNMYYAKRPFWSRYFDTYDGRTDQERGAAAIRTDLLVTERTGNLVAYDEFSAYIYSDTECFVNDTFPLMQAISSLPEYAGFFEKLEQIHPSSRGEKMIAQLRLLAAISANTEP